MSKIRNLPLLSAEEIDGTEVSPVSKNGETFGAQIGQLGAAQTGLATTQAGIAQAAAVTAAQASAARFQHFGSAMLPFENGRVSNPRKNGQFLLTGVRTQMSGTGTVGDFWRGPYSFVSFCAPHRQRVDGQNFFPTVFGNAGSNSTTTNRSTGLSYLPRENLNVTNPADRGGFRFFVRGETAAGTLTISSPAQIPVDAPGPFAVFGSTDGTDSILRVLDCTTGIWYDGTPVANPGGWGGVTSFPFTNDMVFGSAVPTFPSSALQTATHWRGSIGDQLFCNVELTKANVEAMVAGGNPASIAIAAGATRHLHVPLTVGGQLVSTVNTGFTGAVLTQQGLILPGQNMRQQGATDWILLDPFNTPEHFPVELNGDLARVRIKGRVGGLTGILLFRAVLADGRVWTDWQDTRIPIVGGAFDGHVSIPEFFGKAQIQVAMSSNLSIIAASHVDCQSGPVVEAHAQSEWNFAMFDGRTTNGTATFLNPTLPENADTVVFASTTRFLSSQDQPGYLGNGAVALVNYIRSKTQRSILIRSHAIDGTSPISMMNDDDPSRSWQTLVDIRNLTRAKGPRGEAVVTGHLIAGWEANLSPVNVMPAAYVPLLQGTASGTTTVAGSSIAQADLDHFFYDGSSSFDAKMVICPSNRATVAVGTGVVSDRSNAADRRDHMRNYSHLLGYEIGPETTAHRMEGEVNNDDLAPGNRTHPRPNNWEGASDMALAFAQGILQAAGIGTYPGPVFFESIRAGSASNKVIVKVGDPRPHPGLGLATGSTGHNLAPQSVIARSQIRLHTKRDGGDAGSRFEARIQPSGGSFGAWSKLNVLSGEIISAREVELTLAVSLNPGDTVEIAHNSGSSGRYSTATITQANWLAGALYFTGDEYPSGGPSGVSDLIKLGWEVAGSNQALSFTA